MPDSVYALFASVAARHGSRTAVEVQRRDGLESVSYTRLQQMAEIAAAGLREQGLAAGERCALLADNDAEWCAAYLGIARLGAVAVPFDTAYKAKQLATLLRDCDARLIVTTPDYLARVRDALASLNTGCRAMLLRGAAAGLPTFDGFSNPVTTALPPCPATRDDPAVFLYTSGTTSDPKGVVLTHGNLLAEGEAVFQVVHITEADCVLSVLPLFHALAQMANLLLPFSVGARVVFLETVNTTELLRALQERGVTAFCCVPQFFYLIHQRVMQQVNAGGMLKRKVFRLLLSANGTLRAVAGLNAGGLLFGRVHAVLGPRMRVLVTGGSRFDPAIGRDLYRLGFDILQAYGLTECSGGAVITRSGDRLTTAVGHPLPNVEVKILPPETGAHQAEDGEIALRGPIVMPGYFNRPDATAEALHDGWLHTGDLGRLDAEGRVYVTGRRKELIVLSSGKNIYPEEIEAHYQQSPFIKELCVIGLQREDEPSAERLYAVIVPDEAIVRERKIVNVGELLRFEIEGLSVQLPNHKRILGYEIASEDLPRTTTRKLKRFEIERRVRERGASSTPREVAAPTDEDVLWAADPDVAAILSTIQSVAGHAAVRPDANLELDLGLDSMERVELLTQLEQQCAVSVPEEVAQRIYTVRELVDALRSQAGGAMAMQVEADPWARLLAEEPAPSEALTSLLAPKPIVAALTFAVAKVAIAIARVSVGFRAGGLEHLPRDGSYIISPNHQSYLDPFFVVGALPFHAFRKLFFVGASEYFETPLTRRLAHLLNIVPVDPDANLVRAMQAGAFGLSHGKILILFPEGERSIDGTVKKFKKGALILSRHLGVPILPVAIDGVYELWPRNRPLRWSALLPWSSARIRLKFGAPLVGLAASSVAGSGQQGRGSMVAVRDDDYGAGAEQLRAVVATMWDEVRAERAGRV